MASSLVRRFVRSLRFVKSLEELHLVNLEVLEDHMTTLAESIGGH